MKKLAYLATLVVVALVVLVPIALAQGQDQSVQPVPIQDVASVSIEDSYDPADVAVASGDTVTWTNEDEEPHTVTADDGSFDSGVLNPGDTYTATFLGSGTVTYYCTLHPWMVGGVNVDGDVGGGGATPTTTEQQSSGEDTYESMETAS